VALAETHVSEAHEAAIKLFQQLESNYPFGTYAAQAQREIAYAHYTAGDEAEALAAVERFIKLHPQVWKVK
jgi:outer membrane protein assembly factor BamD